MGMFDEVLCNHELFGVHKGETQQTKSLNWFGGALEQYEITPSGRLEFLEYITEDRGDPNAQGWVRLGGAMTMVFTGGRRDLNYHGWLDLSCFGRAKFTDGMLVAFEPEPGKPRESASSDEVSTATQCGEMGGVAEGDPVPESTEEIERRWDLAVIARRFRGANVPSWEELDAFVNGICPFLRSQLAWVLNRSLGLDASAIRQLLEDKSILDGVAEEWLRFEEG